ncbi:hypothetical protein [Cupriavidus sp. amp6]|nr:hypothetical protein [Cupriavidus sp. amp6]
MRSTNTDAQYDVALAAFSDHLDQVQPMLHWVSQHCQDRPDLFNNP